MAQTCLIAPDVIAAYQINCTENVRYPHRFAAYHACGVTFGSNEIICDYVDRKSSEADRKSSVNSKVTLFSRPHGKWNDLRHCRDQHPMLAPRCLQYAHV